MKRARTRKRMTNNNNNNKRNKFDTSDNPSLLSYATTACIEIQT